MKNSAHRRWKGCCLLCAVGSGKVKGFGRHAKDPFAVRRAVGKSRRLTRKYLGDYEN
jgi:hypothetical protein